MTHGGVAKLRPFFGEMLSIAMALTIVLVVRTVAAEPFNVPSPSMVPTLLVGDTLIAGKYAYGYSKFSSPIGWSPNFSGRVLEREPARGDVIVFRLPRDTSVNYVKRVVGLPGDRIQMRRGRLYINGTLVPRRDGGFYPSAVDGRGSTVRRYIETLPGGHEHEILETSDTGTFDRTAEYKVPAGHYFMLGDNRDNSLDSRVPMTDGGVGFVPVENLVGRVDRIMYSRDPQASWWHGSQLTKLFRPGRFFAAVE